MQSAFVGGLRIALDQDASSIVFIEGRVKTSKSIRDNYLKYGGVPDEVLSLEDFLAETTDILGCRVVLFYERDIERIAETLERAIGTLTGSSECRRVEKLTARDIERGSEFGYRATHIFGRNVNFPECFSCFRAGVPAEIQIRTLLSDAWARHSHKFAYKDPIPHDVRRKFDALAASLETADALVQELASVSALAPTATPVSEALSWSETVDRLVAATGEGVNEDEISSLYATWSNASKSTDIGEFEKDVVTSWGKWNGFDFGKYNISDPLLKLKIALYAFDVNRFSHLIPLYRRKYVGDIIYIRNSQRTGCTERVVT